MSVTYNKYKDGSICLEGLELEINASLVISQTLELLIVENSYYIEATFANALTTTEEDELDNIIENHTCDTDANDATTFEDLATVQLSNLNQVHEITPTTFDTIDMSNVLIENKPDVLRKTTSDNFGIEVLESGLYKILLNVNYEIDVGEVSSKLVILRNGQEIDVDGSESNIRVVQAVPWNSWGYGNQYINKTANIDRNLNLQMNDILYIKFTKTFVPYGGSSYYASSFPQIDSDVYAKILKNLIFSVTKIDGATGPKGNDGLPANPNLTLKKQGAIKASEINTINYTGNVTVTNDGNNQATVSVTNDNNNFALHQIMGADNIISEPMAFLVDSTRNDKLLSIETSKFLYAEQSLNSNDWVQIGSANDTDSGYAMPYDGVIVRISARAAESKGGGEINIIIDDDINGAIPVITMAGNGNDPENGHCTNVNIPFDKNSTIRSRLYDNSGGSMKAVTITIWVKWEVRN